jgi:hypothetical protein
LVSARPFKNIWFILLTIAVPLSAQNNLAGKLDSLIHKTEIDSLLNAYYLDGVRDFIGKLGVLSVQQKNLSLKRNDFNKRLEIQIQRSLILSKNDLQVTMQYQIKPDLYIKGKSTRSFKGTKNSINLLYKLEYEALPLLSSPAGPETGYR